MLVAVEHLLLLRFDHAAQGAVRLRRSLPDLADRRVGGHALVDQICGEHRTGPSASGVAVHEDLLALGELPAHERDELVDLVEGRRGKILDADLLVLKARVLDLKRVQAVALEAHHDGEAHLPQPSEVPLHIGGARKPGEAAPVDRVVEQLHGPAMASG